MALDMNSIPALAPGCRLHATKDVLLVPEGTLNLNGPSRDILTRVDGKRSVRAVVNQLLQEYEGVADAEIRTDVLALLEDLRGRGVLRMKP